MCMTFTGQTITILSFLSLTIFTANVSQDTNCMIWANYWFECCFWMESLFCEKVVWVIEKCSFCTNFLLVLYLHQMLQFFFISCFLLALSLSNIFYFLSTLNTFYTVTYTKWFFLCCWAHKSLPSFEEHHIYWPQSNWSLTYSNSQPITNGSNTLLKWDVKEIILTSSSLIGLFVFCSGVQYSVRHGFGQSPVCTMLRKILPAGAASSGANSFTIRRGKSPGTDDRVFFDRLPRDQEYRAHLPG